MDRQLDRIADAHGVRLLVQFGSTVARTTHPGSDVDLAVLLDRPDPSYGDLADLQAALQPLFPGREIDLGLLNHADPLFLHQVTERGVLLVGAPDQWQALRAYAFKRYQDHRRFLAMERDYVARFIERAGR